MASSKSTTNSDIGVVGSVENDVANMQHQAAADPHNMPPVFSGSPSPARTSRGLQEHEEVQSGGHNLPLAVNNAIPNSSSTKADNVGGNSSQECLVTGNPPKENITSRTIRGSYSSQEAPPYMTSINFHQTFKELVNFEENNPFNFFPPPTVAPPPQQKQQPRRPIVHPTITIPERAIPVVPSLPGMQQSTSTTATILGGAFGNGTQLGQHQMYNQRFVNLNQQQPRPMLFSSAPPPSSSSSTFRSSQQSFLEQQQLYRHGKAPIVANVPKHRPRITLAPKNYIMTSAMKLIFGNDYEPRTSASADSSADQKAKRPKLTRYHKTG